MRHNYLIVLVLFVCNNYLFANIGIEYSDTLYHPDSPGFIYVIDDIKPNVDFRRESAVWGNLTDGNQCYCRVFDKNGRLFEEGYKIFEGNDTLNFLPVGVTKSYEEFKSSTSGDPFETENHHGRIVRNDDFIYELMSDGTLSLTFLTNSEYKKRKNGYMFFPMDSIIVVDGLRHKVQFVDDYAFCYSDIESLKIPSYIKRIGIKAFCKCLYLENLYIPKWVTIDMCCFMNCINLKEVNFNAQEISQSCFENNRSLKTIYIGKNVRHICGKSFYGCCSLEQIDIPVNITSLSGYWECDEYIGKAFANCDSLSRVYVHWKKPIKIPDDTFDNSPNVTVYVPLGTIKEYQNLKCWNKLNLKEFSY